MRHVLFAASLAIFGILTVLVTPDSAWAWGPGSHMVMGNWILQNLGALHPSLAHILISYTGLFLNGCLSADMFIGKGSVAKEGHSHNWESGFSLLANARSDAARAYAYGYLSHLAADTVAHNVFVPGLLDTAPGNGRMAHVYLEMQADRLLHWDKADALAVFQEWGCREAECLLRDTLRRNNTVFRLQSAVFKKGIAIGGSSLWRRSLRVLDGFFPDRDAFSERLDTMLAVSTRAAVDVLRHKEDSCVTTLDPIGEKALARAIENRSSTGFIPSAPVASASLVLPDILLSLPRICGRTKKVAA